MQLDDMKQVWAAHGADLQQSLAINDRLLRELLLRKVRSSLAPYVMARALEVALGIAATIVVVSVLASHGFDPRYLVVGGTLAVFAIAITAMCAYLLVSCAQLDYNGPVTEIQRDVERIKLVEYRSFKWALLGGVLLWLPALLLCFEALTGVDALARVQLAYLVANLVVGLLVLAAGQLWSRKYVEREDLSLWARRLVDALSGRSLRCVSSHLAELAGFERESDAG